MRREGLRATHHPFTTTIFIVIAIIIIIIIFAAIIINIITEPWMLTCTPHSHTSHRTTEGSRWDKGARSPG